MFNLKDISYKIKNNTRDSDEKNNYKYIGDFSTFHFIFLCGHVSNGKQPDKARTS